MAKMIACLGWGSLIWDQRELRTVGDWHEDGPMVPIEYTRQSSRGRVTLVITPGAEPVRVLWAKLDYATLEAARLALGRREGIGAKFQHRSVGSWQPGASVPANIPGLAAWVSEKAIDAVVWTALQPKFDEVFRVATVEEVLRFFERLSGDDRKSAEEYVCKTPRQVMTSYRKKIEDVLGWKPPER